MSLKRGCFHRNVFIVRLRKTIIWLALLNKTNVSTSLEYSIESIQAVVLNKLYLALGVLVWIFVSSFNKVNVLKYISLEIASCHVLTYIRQLLNTQHITWLLSSTFWCCIKVARENWNYLESTRMKVSLLLSGFKCEINEQSNSVDHALRQSNFSYVFVNWWLNNTSFKMSFIGVRTTKKTPSGQKNIIFLRTVQDLPTVSSFSSFSKTHRIPSSFGPFLH